MTDEPKKRTLSEVSDISDDNAKRPRQGILFFIFFFFLEKEKKITTI